MKARLRLAGALLATMIAAHPMVPDAAAQAGTGAPGGGAQVGAQAETPEQSGTAAPAPVEDRKAEDLRLAAEDFERGAAAFFKGKGAERLKEASAAFTAVIDRLSPYALSLDPEGRRILARSLDYRAQIGLLRKQNASADADFRLLVETDPAYELDPAATSRKILDRFRKIRTPLIATVVIAVSPPEAETEWNGRSLGPGSGLTAPITVLAGSYTARAHLACFEDKQIEGKLEPNEVRSLELRLDPASRSVRFETVPEGFDVELDGTAAGRTVSSDAGAESGSLTVPCLSAGDHSYALRRDCYKTVTGTVSVVVDFVDREPAAVRVLPEKKVARLSVESDVPGALVFYDGSPIGAAPLASHALCPGTGTLEVRSADRLLWSDRVELSEGSLDVRAVSRPTLRSVVQEGEGARRLPGVAAARIRERIGKLSGFNHVAGASTDQIKEIEGEETTAPRAAKPRRLEIGADLALIVDGSSSTQGSMVRMRLTPAHTGFLQTELCGVEDTACLDRFFASLAARWPVWGARAGAGVVDTLDARGIRVVSLDEVARGADLREGDIIVSAAGQPVTAAVQFQGILDESVEGDTPFEGSASLMVHEPEGLAPGPENRPDPSADAPAEEGAPPPPHEGGGRASKSERPAEDRTVPIVVQRGASRVSVALPVRRAPIISPPSSAPVPAGRILAVADFEASVLPPGERRNAALMTAASVFIGHGDPARALSFALGRAGWSDDVTGASSTGTAAFLSGLCHEILGEKQSALADFTKAAGARGAALWTPDGLPVAPLARMKLKALGRQQPVSP